MKFLLSALDDWSFFSHDGYRTSGMVSRFTPARNFSGFGVSECLFLQKPLLMLMLKPRTSLQASFFVFFRALTGYQTRRPFMFHSVLKSAVMVFFIACPVFAHASVITLYDEDFETGASGFDQPASFQVVNLGTAATPDWIGSFDMLPSGAANGTDNLTTSISLPVGATEIDMSFDYGFENTSQNNVRVVGKVRFLDASNAVVDGFVGGNDKNNFDVAGGGADSQFSSTIAIPAGAVTIDAVQVRFIQIVRDALGEQPIDPPNTAYVDNVLITAVPEPGSIGLLAAGGLLLLARGRMA
jgi:hypothetical protein